MYQYFTNNGLCKTLKVSHDTYKKVVIISDVHGEYDKYMRLKKTMNDFKDCLVICLGDIEDRGPDSVSLLKEFMHHEGYEIAMVMGNHEYLLLDWIRNDYPYGNPYYFNTGEQLLRSVSKDEINEIAEWIETLPLSMSVEIAGQIYELAHATIIDCVNYDPEDLIWCSRVKRLLFSGESILQQRKTIGVVGHNPTRLVRNWLEIMPQRGTENDILSVGNRLFFIDCGCGKPDQFGNNMLGALVIDTKTGELSEVYIK